MFNFKLYNLALEDATLTDKEFRMLCLFLNKSSYDNSNTIEMFNGFLMDKLNLCERHVQRLTKSLCEKGYLTKIITGTVRNINANTYTLKGDIMGDKNVTPCNDDKNVTPCNDDKNVTLYKEHINNKNNKDIQVYSNSTYNPIGNSNNNKEKINKKEMDNVNTSKSEMEQVITSAMDNIRLDQDVMYHSKSQVEYDTALEDLQHQLKKIKDNTSNEAYKNYRNKLGKWFNAALPYMKYANSSTVGKKSTNPNVTIKRTLKKTLSNIDQYTFDFWLDVYLNGNPKDIQIETTPQQALEKMWVKWENVYDPSVIEHYKSIVDNAKQYPKLEEDSLTDMVSECTVIPISA